MDEVAEAPPARLTKRMARALLQGEITRTKEVLCETISFEFEHEKVKNHLTYKCFEHYRRRVKGKRIIRKYKRAVGFVVIGLNHRGEAKIHSQWSTVEIKLNRTKKEKVTRKETHWKGVYS